VSSMMRMFFVAFIDVIGVIGDVVGDAVVDAGDVDVVVVVVVVVVDAVVDVGKDVGANVGDDGDEEMVEVGDPEIDTGAKVVATIGETGVGVGVVGVWSDVVVVVGHGERSGGVGFSKVGISVRHEQSQVSIDQPADS